MSAKTRLPDFEPTDLGNAKRLIARHGKDLRFVPSTQKWYCWDGKRWCLDGLEEIQRRAKETVESIAEEARKAKDSSVKARLVKHAEKSQSARAVRAMIDLARSDERVVTSLDAFDRDPFLLNVKNGTLDLRTGELLPHRQGDLLSQLAPVDYVEGAVSKEWDQFLERIFGGDRELIEFAQRTAGYTLTGNTDEECCFFLHGSGRNGKGTFTNALQSVLGDYVKTAETSTFLAKNKEGPRDDINRLRGARLVLANEANRGDKIAEGILKQLTGGDVVTARPLYGQHFEYTPTFKIVFSVNDLPRLNHDDSAVWARIREIPFAVTIPEGERDPGLKKRLSIVRSQGLPFSRGRSRVA